MTTTELLALPVGSVLRLEEADTDCEVVERYADGSTRIMLWDDRSADTIISPDDEGVSEFAGSLELVVPEPTEEVLPLTQADEPMILEFRR